MSSEKPAEEPSGAAEEQAQVAEADAAEKENAGSDLEQQLAEARARAEENHGNYLRALAELENVRKRAQRDVEHAHKFALEKFANEMLTVRDSLEMGLNAAQGENADVETLRQGKEVTLKQLTAALEKFGITEINPEGQPFNPEFHEAMAMQESAEAEPDTVLHVVQKGYLLNGRLLRPARVIVARAPADDESAN
ncbi:MAG: nucleotide exchange factor GrpE [Gammaproteobacteria bacterium]|jgi:molecular chaperone GrpE